MGAAAERIEDVMIRLWMPAETCETCPNCKGRDTVTLWLYPAGFDNLFETKIVCNGCGETTYITKLCYLDGRVEKAEQAASEVRSWIATAGIQE